MPTSLIENFGATVRDLYECDTAIVALCAAGIVIRSLAPLLQNKRAEPPVLAVAEDGSAVVPLLGGLRGVNALARRIGAALAVAPAITTAGDLRFGTCLLDPPPGYALRNPADGQDIHRRSARRDRRAHFRRRAVADRRTIANR